MVFPAVVVVVVVVVESVRIREVDTRMDEPGLATDGEHVRLGCR